MPNPWMNTTGCTSRPSVGPWAASRWTWNWTPPMLMSAIERAGGSETVGDVRDYLADRHLDDLAKLLGRKECHEVDPVAVPLSEHRGQLDELDALQFEVCVE